MSGEITVTRGKNWTPGERVDHAKLNQTGAPTARIDAGAITATELDTASVGEAVAEATKGANLFRNPALIPDLWRHLTDPIAVTVAGRVQPAEGWFVNPAGAAATVIYSTSVPTGSAVGQSMELGGAASVTTVDVGQFIPSWIASTREDYTLRFYLYNGTGADFIPTVRIDAASTTDDESTTTNAYAADLSNCPNSQWKLIEEVIDASALDLEDGADFVIRIPSGSLNSTGKIVRIARLQLTPNTISAPWVHPAPPAIYDNLYAIAAPTVDDDGTQGYSTNSTWIWGTRVYVCSDPTPGAAEWQEITTPITEEVIIAHSVAQNTAGGAATSGSWETVNLNTILMDTADLANPENDDPLSVSSGTIELPPGYWEIDIEVPRNAVNQFQCRLYNVDTAAVAKYADTSVDVLGTSAYADATNIGYAISKIMGRLRFSASTTLRVECRVNTTKPTNGCGIPGNFSVEIYALARFRRLSV